jgi:nucleoside-triphosphatase THEP1
MRIIIITGKQSAGKTTLVGSLIESLNRQKIKFDGIISRSILNYNGDKTGFESVRLSDARTELLCHIGLVSQTSTFKYGFSDTAFTLGDCFTFDNIPEIFFLDEVGILESQSKGWADLLRRLLRSDAKFLILSVRMSVLEKIISNFELTNEYIFLVENENGLEKMKNDILKLILQ